ncbi:MAG TPA: rhamnulokinase family protein [Candidatus Limnocylindrales bacterium]
MTGRLVAAVDLGASSGRVMVGRVAPNELELTEVHRFGNDPVRLPGGLHWDILRLYREVVVGLRAAARAAEPAEGLVSIGVDSWGVDHGLLDATGALLGNPVHYRDERTASAVPEVHAIVPPAELYARTGIQHLPLNTIFQLAAERRTPILAIARTMLMIPDLIGFWLSGVAVAERTNASTTGLLDVHRRTWDEELITRLDLPRSLFADLASPGEVIGPLQAELQAEVGAGPDTLLTLVGSHDTASAVVGVPAGAERFAYIASGTWSLVGVELDRPILSEESRIANFTNEGGVDDRIRYLRNVMGLWLLQESLRTWELAGTPEVLRDLLIAAADLPSGGPLIDPDDPVFVPPGDMAARIVDACVRSDQAPPATRPAIARCVLDSLAAAYARTIRDATRLSGASVEVVHLVGGGARNALLCQMTADACELPVLAGPVEATALGNVLVQARARGLLAGDLETLRALVRSTQDVRRYEPRSATTRSRAPTPVTGD